MQLVLGDNVLHLRHAGSVLLAHGADAPCFFTGQGRADVAMVPRQFRHHGPARRTRTTCATWPNPTAPSSSAAMRATQPQLVLRAEENAHGLALAFIDAAPGINRIWIRLPADPARRCGDAASRCRISTCAAAASRSGPASPASAATNPRRSPSRPTSPAAPAAITGPRTIRSPPISRRATSPCISRPPPTPNSTSATRIFTSCTPGRSPTRLEFLAADTLPDLVARIAARFGRQPALPDWTQHGVILGLKRGQAHAEEKLALAERAGIPVAALWCEDWAGVRETSFGTRLFWDWRGRARATRRSRRCSRACTIAASASSATPTPISATTARSSPRRNAQAPSRATQSGAHRARRFRRVRLRRHRLHERGRDRLVHPPHPAAEHARSRARRLDGGFRRIPADRCRARRGRSRCSSIIAGRCAGRRRMRARSRRPGAPAMRSSSCARASPARRRIAR